MDEHHTNSGTSCASTEQQHPVHFLGIDVETKARAALLRFLDRKGVLAVVDCGAYRGCGEHSQVLVDTIFTEAELDTLLYEKFRGYKGASYVGVFTRQDYRKSDGYLWDSVSAVPLSKL